MRFWKWTMSSARRPQHMWPRASRMSRHCKYALRPARTQMPIARSCTRLSMRQAVAKAVVDAAAEAAAAELSFKWCVDELEARLAQAIAAKDELEAAAVKMAEEAAAAKKAEEAAAAKNAEEAAAVKKAEEAAAAKTAEATALVHDASDPRYKRRHRFVQASPYCPYHRIASIVVRMCLASTLVFGGSVLVQACAVALRHISRSSTALRLLHSLPKPPPLYAPLPLHAPNRYSRPLRRLVCLFVCLSVLAGIVVFE